MRIFNGLLRDEMARMQAQQLGGGVAAPRDPQPHRNGRYVRLIICPKCRTKNLPYYNAPDDAVHASRCGACGQVAVFHETGANPTDLIRRTGGRHRNPHLRRREHNGREYIDGNAAAEADAVVRDIGRRRAQRQGVI